MGDVEWRPDRDQECRIEDAGRGCVRGCRMGNAGWGLGREQ